MALAARRGRKQSCPGFPGSEPPRTKSLGTIHLVRMENAAMLSHCLGSRWMFHRHLCSVERFLIDGSSAVGTLQGVVRIGEIAKFLAMALDLAQHVDRLVLRFVVGARYDF